MSVVTRRFQRNELFWDFQSLMRARFLLEMAGLRTGMPNGTDRVIEFCGQIILYWSHKVRQQINIVRMSFQSLSRRSHERSCPSTDGSAIHWYSHSHFCIIAAFPLLNCNELSHNLFHLPAISRLWMFTNRSKELIFQDFNHTKRECLIL